MTLLVRLNKSLCYIMLVATIYSSSALAQLSFSLSSSTGNFSITCTHPVLTISATSTYTAAAVSYSWNVPISAVVAPSVNVGTSGIFQVVALAGSVSAVQNFTLWNDQIPPSIAYSLPGILSCLSPSLNAPVFSVPSATLSWVYQSSVSTNVSAFGFSALANYSLSPTNTLVASYTVTATDTANGCATSATIPLYQDIYPPHVAVSGLTSSALTCLTPSIVLTNASTSGIPPNSMFPNTGLITASWYQVPTPTISLNFTYTFSLPGTYTVVAEDETNGCKSSSLITIEDNRIAPTITVPGAYMVTCPNGTVDLSPAVEGDSSSVSYHWTVPAGASVSDTTRPQLTTNAQGNYTLTVTSHSTGCSSQALLSVWACVGIAEQAEPLGSLTVFPNPAGNYLFLSSPTGLFPEGLELRIRNTLGQVVCSKTLKYAAEKTDIGQLTSGIYYVDVTDPRGHRVFKILKE